MNKFKVGDKVCLTEDRKHVLTVFRVCDDENIELKEFSGVSFNTRYFELVEKTPYEHCDRLYLAAITWNEGERCFQKQIIKGVVEQDGYIRFLNSMYDHHGISVCHLNTIRAREADNTSCDCAFCELDDEKIQKVKQLYMRRLERKVSDAKEEYDYLTSQAKAMRQQIGEK